MGPMNRMLELAEPQQPVDQLDWWQRLLRSRPHSGGQFQDDVFQSPPHEAARTLEFDAMGAHEQPAYQDWVANRMRQMERPLRFK